MKDLPCITLAIAAAALAFTGNQYWGWFLLAAVMVFTTSG